MALNLNSLKKISLSPIPPIEQKNNNTLISIDVSKTIVANNIPEIQNPLSSPKISLMKLKIDSGLKSTLNIDQPIISKEPVFSLWDESSIQKDTNEIIEIHPKVAVVEIVKEENIWEIPLEKKESSTGEIKFSGESESILISSKDKDKDKEIHPPVPQKEFFPKFQVTHMIDIDEELFDVQDRTLIDDNKKESIFSDNNVVTNITHGRTIDWVDKNVSAEKEPGLPWELIAPTKIPEEIANEPTHIVAEEGTLSKENEKIPPKESNTPLNTITPEYIAEVKTELSEGRRAGFRFFLQKKSKIMAGVSFVLISTIALIFSGSFHFTDIQKSWKGNIQERIENLNIIWNNQEVKWDIKEAEINSGSWRVVPPFVPPSEPINYERGVDYSVTKNTKKNIQSKTLSWALLLTP